MLSLSGETEVIQFLSDFWVPILDECNVSRRVVRVLAGDQRSHINHGDAGRSLARFPNLSDTVSWFAEQRGELSADVVPRSIHHGELSAFAFSRLSRRLRGEAQRCQRVGMPSKVKTR